MAHVGRAINKRERASGKGLKEAVGGGKTKRIKLAAHGRAVK